MEVDLSELSAWRFACLPGCGFCCTTSPTLVEDEPSAFSRADGLASLVRQDPATGRTGLRLDAKRGACAALGVDRACTIYDDRPQACRLFPLHVHLGPRVQVSVNLGCPGLQRDSGEPLTGAAQVTLNAALTPAARAMAERARLNFEEFNRRASTLGEVVAVERLGALFEPHVEAFLDASRLPGLLDVLDAGDLLSSGVGQLAGQADKTSDPGRFAQVARDWFGGDPLERPSFVTFPELQWISPRLDARDRFVAAGLPAVPLADVSLTPEAEGLAVLGDHLRVLARRDHAAGLAAHVVDATGYAASPAAAYGRVLAEAAANLLLGAGLFARWRGAARPSRADCQDAVRLFDMAFLSQPTIGAVL